MVDRQIQRHLPAQIKAQRLHRAPVRQPVAIGQQQHLREQARSDRRPPPPRRIALREILVADDPIAVAGQQRVDRVLRQKPRAPRRVKEPLLTFAPGKHPDPPKPPIYSKIYGPDRTDPHRRSPRLFQRSRGLTPLWAGGGSPHPQRSSVASLGLV